MTIKPTIEHLEDVCALCDITKGCDDCVGMQFSLFFIKFYSFLARCFAGYNTLVLPKCITARENSEFKKQHTRAELPVEK